MINESDSQTGAQVLSISKEPAPSVQVEAMPEGQNKSPAQIAFEEKAAVIPQWKKTNINHTLAFIEGGLKQVEQVKAAGHTPESFLQGFAQLVMEYHGLRESGTDVKRAQMLTLMKMRAFFVDDAYAQVMKEKKN